jgi:Fe-S-cluster formation regulator IscX/YfhJ
MNIRPLAAKLSQVDGQTDGQTDLRKLIVSFRNFADTIRSFCSLFSVVD